MVTMAMVQSIFLSSYLSPLAIALLTLVAVLAYCGRKKATKKKPQPAAAAAAAPPKPVPAAKPPSPPPAAPPPAAAAADVVTRDALHWEGSREAVSMEWESPHISWCETCFALDTLITDSTSTMGSIPRQGLCGECDAMTVWRTAHKESIFSLIARKRIEKGFKFECIERIRWPLPELGDFIFVCTTRDTYGMEWAKKKQKKPEPAAAAAPQKPVPAAQPQSPPPSTPPPVEAAPEPESKPNQSARVWRVPDFSWCEICGALDTYVPDSCSGRYLTRRFKCVDCGGMGVWTAAHGESIFELIALKRQEEKDFVFVCTTRDADEIKWAESRNASLDYDTEKKKIAKEKLEKQVRKKRRRKNKKKKENKKKEEEQREEEKKEEEKKKIEKEEEEKKEEEKKEEEKKEEEKKTTKSTKNNKEPSNREKNKKDEKEEIKPRDMGMDEKQMAIAKGGTRNKLDYPTMKDIESDWDFAKDKRDGGKKEEGKDKTTEEKTEGREKNDDEKKSTKNKKDTPKKEKKEDKQDDEEKKEEKKEEEEDKKEEKKEEEEKKKETSKNSKKEGKKDLKSKKESKKEKKEEVKSKKEHPSAKEQSQIQMTQMAQAAVAEKKKNAPAEARNSEKEKSGDGEKKEE